MNTLIINGSPKAEKGNTEYFIREFMKDQKTVYEVRYAAKEDSLFLANYLETFDTVIFAMPLYIHAMPGIVMKIFECMRQVKEEHKSIGFMVQSGFAESAQSKFLERYLEVFSRRLGYYYLGTLIKGSCAGIYMMPERFNKKLFLGLNRFGINFEETGEFDQELVKEFGKHYKFTKVQCRFFTFLQKIGLESNLFFNMMIKQNNAYDQRYNQPFKDTKNGKIK